MSVFGLFLLGFVLLVFAADSLQRGVAGLGQRLGLSKPTAGLLVPGLAAALPGIALSAFAFDDGAPALALGNAVGGGVANLGLVVGVLAVGFSPVPAMRTLSTQAVLVAVAIGLLLVFGLDSAFARWEGALLLLTWIAASAAVYGRSRLEGAAIQQELAESAETSAIVGQNVVRLAMGAALLFFGCKWIVSGAAEVGAMLGLKHLATGLFVLGTGAALPVLVPAALAAARDQANVALSQALGAALCHLLLATAIPALSGGLELPPVLLRFSLPVLFVLTGAIWLLLRSGSRFGRREGMLLLAVFAAWLVIGLARDWP